LEPDEWVAFYFDEAKFVPKVGAQLRCDLGSNDYAAVLERWDAPRVTEHGYARIVAEAEKIRAGQAAAGSGDGGTGRSATVFRIGCLLYRFTDDDDAVSEAAWLYQSERFGDDALDHREVRRQLRGSSRKVGDEIAVEVTRRNTSKLARE